MACGDARKATATIHWAPERITFVVDKAGSFIEIEQTLDRDVDPLQVGERKGGCEEQLKRDPIDRLDL